MNADRGLCGGIHSYVSKQLRPIISVDSDAKLIVYGDKVRSQMQRFAPENIQVVFADVGKRVCAWWWCLSCVQMVRSLLRQGHHTVPWLV